MASVTFERAMEYPERMTIISPDNKNYCGYYIDPRVDRKTLPEGWNAYDIRHDDDGCGIFVTLEHNYVFVNSMGSFITRNNIKELELEGSFIKFKIDEEEWYHAHEDSEDPDKEIDEPTNCPNDWDWTYGGGTSPIIIEDEDKFYGRK